MRVDPQEHNECAKTMETIGRNILHQVKSIQNKKAEPRLNTLLCAFYSRFRL